MSIGVAELKADKYGKGQKGKGHDKEQKLEENGFFEPGSKAYVGKSKANEKGAAGRIEYVCVSVGKEVSKDNNGFADALNGSEGKHGDDQNGLGR